MQLSFLRPLYDRPGPWCSVYLDASADTEDAHAALDLRWRALREQLQEQQADPASIEAIDRVVRGHDPMPGDYGIAVFASHGRVALSEYLSAPPLRDIAAFAPLPHVMPLLAQRGEQVAWVRVIADRTGADAMAVSAGGVHRRAHVRGREEYQLRRVRPGGWSQSRYQRAAMEAWHRNAGDVAAATAELAERWAPTWWWWPVMYEPPVWSPRSYRNAGRTCWSAPMPVSVPTVPTPPCWTM